MSFAKPLTLVVASFHIPQYWNCVRLAPEPLLGIYSKARSEPLDRPGNPAPTTFSPIRTVHFRFMLDHWVPVAA